MGTLYRLEATTAYWCQSVERKSVKIESVESKPVNLTVLNALSSRRIICSSSMAQTKRRVESREAGQTNQPNCELDPG